MGLLGHSEVPPTRFNGMRLGQSVLGTTLPIIIGQQRQSWQLLWYGDFQSAKAKQAGGSGLAKGGVSYVYSASVIGAVCMGNCTNFLGVWDSSGRYAMDTYTESYTISGTYSYTPVNATIMKQDLGVGAQTPYSVTANDYGSPGSITYSGTQQVPLTFTTSPTPAAGEYTVDSTNNYIFNAADAGTTVVITYVAYRYHIQETEIDVVPATTPYKVTVQYQSEYFSDVGVSYYPSGVAFTAVGGTPTAAGTYNPNNGNYLFAAADAGLGITITYIYKDPNQDNNAPSTLNLTFFGGGLGQTPWSYMTSKFPGEALGYSEICYVGSSALYLGYSPTLPQYNFEILGNYSFGNGIPDACPADAIEGVLTNPAWGVGFDPSYIDGSLQGNARDYWCANNFFISALLVNQSSAMSVMGDWLEAGNTYVTWDEGLLKFVALGDTTTVANGSTYTPNTQPVIDLDDNDFIVDGNNDPITIEQSPWQTRWNRTGVRWSVRSNDYNEDILQVEDAASISQYGLMVEEAKSYQFLTTLPAAQFAANCHLQRTQSIFTTYSFTLKSNFAFLSPGDIITVTDGLLGTTGTMFGRTPVRITKMTDDPEKGIAIEAETFPWSVGTALLYNRQAQIPSNTLDGAQQDPGDTTAVIFEVPDRAQQYTGDSIYVFVNGANSNWGGCEAWVSYNGTDYNWYGTFDTPGRIGITTQYLPYHTDPDTDDTLIVNMQQSDAELQTVTLADRDAFVTLSGLVSTGSTKSPQMLATQGANFGATTTTGSGGSQGPIAVTSGSDNPNGSATIAWSNPGNVTGTSAYATASFATGTQQAGPNNSPIPGGAVYSSSEWNIASVSPNQLRTDGSVAYPHQMGWVYFQGLGFNVPSGATITGVQVQLGYVSQNATTAVINGVSLYHSGAAIGTTVNPNLTFQPSTQTMVQGSSTDTWGATLTPSVVNDSTFGFGVTMYIQNVRLFMQNAYLTAYYTTGSGIQSQATHYLEATFINGGGFTVPVSGIGAISGVKVDLTGYVSASASGAQPSLWAQLVVNGNPSGNPRLVWDGTSSFPTSPTAYTLGTSTDNWGLANLTATQVNAQGSTPAFGVLFYATIGGPTGASATVDVKGVTMEVYWGAGSSGVAWTNPGNVASSSSYAQATLTSTTNTVWLVAEAFGFSLPYGTVSGGIQISFEAYTDTATNANISVIPFYAGERLGLIKNIQPTTTNTVYNLGSSTDLWGFDGWSVDEWNNSSFGVAFLASGNSGANFYIRNVRITLTGTSSYDVELISYEDATLVGQNTYALSSLRRGAMGSYPCEHPAGATFVRIDQASFVYQVDPVYRGQTIYFKFPSFNAYGNQLQPLASISAYPLLITDNSVGAIDGATGSLVTGTPNNPVTRMDDVVSVVQGTYGIQNVPQGYTLAQLAAPGTAPPTWVPIVTGGGGSGTISNVYVIEQAANFLAAAWDVCLVDTSGGNVTATLPLAGSNTNVTVTIKKVTSDANTVTIVGTGSDTVEGGSSLTIHYKGSSVQLVSDGVSNWDIL